MTRAVPVLFLLAGLAKDASAADKVVVVKTADSPAIAELSAGFHSAFPEASPDDVLLGDSPAAEADLMKHLSSASAILSIGPRAAAVVAKSKPAGATIACVPGAQADPATQGPTLRLQPPIDGVIAAVAWLGNFKRIGFLVDASNKERLVLAQGLATSRGLTIVPASITSGREVAAAVTDLVGKCDLLVVDLADGLQLQDVQFILRAADTAKIPVVGTAEGFIKAGAPVAVAIDPRNVGAEAGKLAKDRASGLFDPRHFRLLVNLSVTQRLGLTVPQDKGTVADNILTLDSSATDLVASGAGGSTLTAPAVTRRGRLSFPPLALQTGVRSAAVALEVTVKGDGTVGDAKVLTGDPIFAQAALDAVKTFQFKPGTKDGAPVEAKLKLNLQFQR